MQQPAGSYWTTRRKRKRWQKLVLFLSCLVVFSTTYALILPAITMTEPPLCGLEEHQHDSSCYEVVLNCPFAETASTVRTDEPEATSATFESEPQSTSAETADTENEVFTEATSAASDSEPQSAPTETSVTESETSAEAISAASSEQPSETQAATPHHHTEGCYQKNLICTLPVHQHSDACYQATDSAPEHSTQEPLPQLNADAVRLTELSAAADTALTAHPGETVCFPLSLKTAPILPDAAYSSIRIRLEIVLPLPEEIAAFDLDAMTWLDQTEGYAPSVAIESRLIGETETPCQVLSGYLLLTAEEPSLSIAATEWSGSVAVSIQTLPEQASFALRIHGAVEYNAWDIVCEEHQTTERLTVDTVVCSVSSEFNPTASSEAYRSYCSAVESLQASETEPQAVNALLDAISTSFAQGILSETAYRELSNRLVQMLIFDSESVAEACIGTNWMQLRDSGWFTYWEQFLTEDTEVPSTSAPAAELPNPGHDDDASDKQVSNWGGATTSEDGLVTVSKTIDGTDTENVFDITLTVQTQQKIEEIYRKPDMSVVIVMDISNTMNDAFPPNNSTDQTRYKAAMLAAEDFLDKFVDGTSDSSEIGYVAFNTSAHQIFGLQNCTTELQANALKNTMRQSTGNIINANGYSGSPTRFTNIEAGLNMAQDMLENASSDYKYIIFLSDGFPTTYVNRNQGRYTGYSPYSTTGTPGTDGVFYDGVAKHYCTMGTNYSDKAAIRASEEATAIKESGITIFSIGVNVEGQTIQSSLDKIPHYYFVDRTSTTYALGGASDTQAFKDWLKNKIGSGYYYDSTDTAGLKAAYADIFEKISSLMGEASKGEWVTEDPLPTSSGSPSQPEELEFIGFYEKDGTLRYDPDDMSKNAFKLIGTAEEDGENSATFTPGTSVIHWDLKTSGYTSSTKDGATTYFYSLTYRVRLKNELRGFVENQPYNTNQPTSMTYRVIETKDGKVTLSKTKKVDYLIPAVHGYLGELTFRKTDPYGHDLAGAVFTLTHDTSSCNICRGDGKNTVERVGTYTATSDETGNVKFTGIPSGHIYTLKETKAPDGYLMDDSITYTVQIAYDQVTVTGKNSSGQDITWNREILNTPITHELPATGGSGLWPWLLTGSALCIGSLTAMTARRKRKKQ